ncbi:hypothetical protein A1D22_05825 [Pasteurellaceae bacterium LFhippo2]|nr:hypothetical protein [Pasteurellaceae bacterium LFhippo2]
MARKEIRYFDYNNLGSRSFKGTTDGTNLIIDVKVSSNPNNRLSLTNDGLEVTGAPTIAQYMLTWATGASAGNGDDTANLRRFVQVRDNLGIIHLDFKMNATGQRALATLPSNCPTPTRLIESQLHDGGTVWVGANSRAIQCSVVSTNTRYIIDLVGFFN